MFCLRRIAEDIEERTHSTQRDFFYENPLRRLLCLLEPHEKVLIAKYFVSLNWDIGSIQVLNILQKCQVLSATEYILKQSDEEHIQLVLNDLLETQYELLANIVANCHYDIVNSAKLTAILEECFSRLFHDLSVESNSLKNNYFAELERLVTDEAKAMLRLVHISVILSLENTTLKMAYVNLNYWHNSIADGSLLQTLLIEMIKNTQQAINYILKRSLESDFRGWKQYVILLEMIVANYKTDDINTTIKKHLKDLFKHFIMQKNEKLFQIMILTARIFYTDKNSENFILDAYASWYKATIGEMTYTVSADEFKFVLGALKHLLSLEGEPSYLEIHANTAISAPPMCNRLVLRYKKECRRRLAALTNENDEFVDQMFETEASIIIDD